MAGVAKDPRDGRWLARWRDPSGRQRKKSFRRKVDAQRWLDQMRAEMHRGHYVDPAAGKASFGPLAEAWAEGLSHLKPSTATRYRSIVRHHILPKWGRWRVAKIGHSDVAAWIGALSAAGLSPGTVRQVHRVLSLILSDAVEDGRIGRNPARRVKLPRQIRGEPRFLTAAEVETLASAAGKDGNVMLLLAFTGLRFGELAGLRVKRVDLFRRRLDIAETLTEIGGHLTAGTPKTHQRRAVVVPRSLMPILVAACAGKGSDEYVFTSPDGGPIRPRNWRARVFDPACAAAGITDLTPHDLRHTAASLAIAQGATVKAVQRMLGHASASMTLDVYAGLFPDELDAVADALDRVVPQTGHNEGSDDDDDGTAGRLTSV